VELFGKNGGRVLFFVPHQHLPASKLKGTRFKIPVARQKETPGIIHRPLATIHKRLGTPAKVV